MLKIKPWIYFSLRIRVQQHSHVRRAGVVGPLCLFLPFSETTWSVCSFLQWRYFNVCSLLANIRYLRLCATLRLPPSFPWEDWLWKYLECTQFTGSWWGLLSLSLTRSQLSTAVCKRWWNKATHTHTHNSVFVYTHTCTPVRAHTHMHNNLSHDKGVSLSLSVLCPQAR